MGTLTICVCGRVCVCVCVCVCACARVRRKALRGAREWLRERCFPSPGTNGCGHPGGALRPEVRVQERVKDAWKGVGVGVQSVGVCKGCAGLLLGSKRGEEVGGGGKRAEWAPALFSQSPDSLLVRSARDAHPHPHIRQRARARACGLLLLAAAPSGRRPRTAGEARRVRLSLGGFFARQQLASGGCKEGDLCAAPAFCTPTRPPACTDPRKWLTWVQTCVREERFGERHGARKPRLFFPKKTGCRLF